MRDVTRQRESEERERGLLADAAAANAKFRAFFEQGALFAGIMDIDGTLLDANRLWWEGCGFTRDEVVGRKFWDGPWWNPSPALVERIRIASRRAAAGEPFREELPYYVGDGSQRVVDVSIQPIRDDRGPGHPSCAHRAPTSPSASAPRRSARSSPRSSRAAPTSSASTTSTAMPTYINRAGLDLVGLADIEEARRTPVREFFFPEDQNRVLNEFFPEVAAQGPRRDRGALSPLPQRPGTLDGLQGAEAPGRERREHRATRRSSQDVTERKRLEIDLRKLASDLADADRRKDEFLATLAHELRNPARAAHQHARGGAPLGSRRRRR